ARERRGPRAADRFARRPARRQTWPRAWDCGPRLQPEANVERGRRPSPLARQLRAGQRLAAAMVLENSLWQRRLAHYPKGVENLWRLHMLQSQTIFPAKGS